MVRSGIVKAYFNDSTLVRLEDSTWFKIKNKPTGLQVTYKEIQNDDMMAKRFEFDGLWMVTIIIHSSGIEISHQMPSIYIKKEDIQSVFSKEEYDLVLLLSGFLFSTDININVLNENRMDDSKQDMIYRRIENTIINHINYSLLDSVNLSVLSNLILETMAGKSSLFRKSPDTLTDFYTDIKLSKKISSFELDDLLRERYPYWSKGDTVIYSPFNFKEAISLTLTDNAIGFGYHNGFTLYMNKIDFIKTLPVQLKVFLRDCL